MTWPARLGERPFKHLVLLSFVLLSVLFELLLVYHLRRSYSVDLGSPGDGVFLSGFWADEADIGFRYRWSKDHSEITFLGAGSARPIDVALRMQGPNVPGQTQPISVTLALNGVPLDRNLVSVGSAIEVREFAIPQPLSSPYTLSLTSTTFAAPGDARTLGVKVDYAEIRQESTGLNLPPLDMVVWLWLFFAGLVGLLLRLRWPVSIGLLILGLALLGFALVAGPRYLDAYLPPVAVVSALVGLLVWQHQRLPRWPFVLDYTGSRPRLATSVMLGVMLLFAAVALWAIPQSIWIGHADYAENANAARSLVEGRGLTVDYAAQFYQDYPGITHPAETWPLLQPLIIAPFFAIFGPVTWAAKLPNLFVLLALAWAVFSLTSRLWDARVGLFAGLLTLFHPYFFNTVLYPINDLAFTTIFFALAWLVWQAFESGAWEVRNDEVSASATENPPASNRLLPPASCLPPSALIGILAGLLVWSKPSGTTLLVGLSLWAFIVWRREHIARKAALPWRSVGIMAGAFSLVLLPLVVRNLVALGTPYFSTESLDAWILRYWPYHEWEDIYKVYVGAADYPHPRWVVGGKFGYQNLLDAIAINFRWVWDKGVMGGIKNAEFITGPVQLLGALVGFVALSRRTARLFGMVFLSIGIYALFVLLYWHFEGRYFQVAIPWLYMLLAWAVVWLWDRFRTLLPLRDTAWLAWSVPLLATAAFLWPSLGELKDHLTFDTRPTSFTVAMDWLSQNSTPSDVIMTRDPWELNWHTGRKAVMIPFEDLDTIKRVAAQYGVTMLQLGGPTDGLNIASCPPDTGTQARFPTGSRPALSKLYCGYEMPGFTRIYQNGDLTIYRLAPSP